MSDPYRVWNLTCPFTKTGFPVMGTFGRSLQQVIVMRVDVFKRLIDEHPSLATAQFEIGELTDGE